MIRTLLSVAKYYDKRFWDWLEGKGDPRPRANRQTVDPVKPRSTKSGRSMDASSIKNEIPDPWD